MYTIQISFNIIYRFL